MPTVIKNVKKSELPHNWIQSVIPGSKEPYTIIIKGAKDTNAKIKGGIINELRKNKIKAFKPMTREEIYQR